MTRNDEFERGWGDLEARVPMRTEERDRVAEAALARDAAPVRAEPYRPWYAERNVRWARPEEPLI